MKDLINKVENDSIPAEISTGFVVAFIHPLFHNFIFLAKDADIKEICYAKDPKLPGTLNIKYAKIYSDFDSAALDVYRLRYHHRVFLKITTIAKPVIYFQNTLALVALDDTDIPDIPVVYDPIDLVSI